MFARGHAGAVLMVTAEGKCHIKVFLPEEAEAAGADATNGQPTIAQVLLLVLRPLRTSKPPMLARALCIGRKP